MKSNVAKKTEPLTIAEELVFIKNTNNGFLDPIKVVEYARDQNTALHQRFEWDDTEAAERYRIWQARMVIRMELTVIDSDNENNPVRMFVSLIGDRRGESDRGYRTMVDVLSDPELRESLLNEAKEDMRTFRRKYDQLKELAKVFSAMEEMMP